MNELYEKVIVTSGRADAEKGRIVTESIHFYPVNGIIIPEDATNGEVIKALFPKAEYEVFEDFLERHVRMRFSDCCTAHFDWHWWNTPYETENKEEGE